MVDKLRRSVETLEAPTCPNCAVEMTWYRAQLLQSTPSIVEHFFQCPNCNRMAQTRITAAGNGADGPKRPEGRGAAFPVPAGESRPWRAAHHRSGGFVRHLIIAAAFLLGTASAAQALRFEREEPRQMRPGETIYVRSPTCGPGHLRQVTADETGPGRTRKCVRWHLFPPEIVLKGGEAE